MEKNSKLPKTEKGWKEKLSSEEYKILRECGTEPAFSGEYVNTKKKGVYKCKACGARLFSSKEKYDSGTGWPSFWDAMKKENIELKEDKSLSMVRTEVVCSQCGSHLGHLFDDGPKPTGKRYCINSMALELDTSEDPKE